MAMDSPAITRPQASASLVAKQFFPLPLVSHILQEEQGDSFDSLTRSACRRRFEKGHVLQWADDAISSLNSMYGGSEFVAEKTGFERLRASVAQHSSVRRILSMVKSMGKPPSDMTSQGALDELRAKLGYDGQPSALAQLQEDLVSLPVAGSQPAPLEKILRDGAYFPCSLLNSKVLPQEAVDGLKAQSSLKKPYFDPLLKHNRRAYSSFIRKLFDSGVIEFSKTCREQCGLFCVWKKSGKQRLVVDARLTNLWFSSPEPVRLATGTSFGAIEVDDHGPIELAGVDISDAFYNIELPESLRDLFGLLPLEAREIGRGRLGQLEVGDHEKVYPVFRAVPMGWTHALWLCQYLHEAVVNDIVGLGSSNRFVDGSIPPNLAPLIHTEYVDNFVALSQCHGSAKSAAEAVSAELQRRGLPVHEVEAGSGGETLGWKFSEDKSEVVVTPKRLWRLRLASQELLKRGHCSGRLLEIILGHFTFVGLLCREFLSCFQACYAFCRKHYHDEVVMWPQVRRELFWASSLLPLVRRDLATPWSARVYATDASFWGRGVAAVDKPVDEVKKVGQVNDRWKFNKSEEDEIFSVETGIPLLPDVETLKVNESAAPAGVGGPLAEARGLSTEHVPLRFLEGDWKKISNGPWERQEGIPTLEGRAIVWVMQHLARSSVQHGGKHLILTDSMSCTLALSKGRSSVSPMNRVCRQVGAILLATGMRVSCRWIPSEMNPADGPSRGKPWQFFARKTASQWIDHAEEGKPFSKHGWRTEAFKGLVRDLDGRSPSQPSGEEEASEEGRKGEHENGARADVQLQPAGLGCNLRPDLFGEKVSVSSSGGLLQEGMGTFRDGLSGGAPAHYDSDAVGCQGHHPCEHVVWRGTQHRRCAHLPSQHQVHSDRCQADEGPSSCLPCSPGFSKVGPFSRQSSSALPVPCLDRSVLGECRGSYGGSLVASDLGSVCPSRGVSETPMETPASSQSFARPVDSDSEWKRCSRTCSAIKSGRGRRSLDDRSTISAVAGSSAQEETKRSKDDRPHLPFRHDRGLKVVQQGSVSAQAGACGNHMLISDPSRKCKHRSTPTASVASRDHEKRQMEKHVIGAPLCQRRSSWRDLRAPDKRPAKRLHPSREIDFKDLGQCVQQQPDTPIALEIFSGSGHFSKALRRHFGVFVNVIELDYIHGPQFDLTKRSLQRFVLRLLRKRHIVFVWLGTPCNTWSRARRGGGNGPAPIRDNDHLWGLPNLSEKDQSKIEVGNALLKFSAAVFRLCVSLKIPVVLENPLTSMLWKTPPIQHLLSHKYVFHEYTDFCQENKPFRKRTQFMFAHTDIRHCRRHCTAKRGVCSKSGKPHVQLVGSKDGVFLTKWAEPYPHRLCQRLASTIAYSCFARLTHPLHKYFIGDPETSLA